MQAYWYRSRTDRLPQSASLSNNAYLVPLSLFACRRLPTYVFPARERYASQGVEHAGLSGSEEGSDLDTYGSEVSRARGAGDRYKPKIVGTWGQRPACLVSASVTYCGNNQICEDKFALDPAVRKYTKGSCSRHRWFPEHAGIARGLRPVHR